MSERNTTVGSPDGAEDERRSGPVGPGVVTVGMSKPGGWPGTGLVWGRSDG